MTVLNSLYLRSEKKGWTVFLVLYFQELQRYVYGVFASSLISAGGFIVATTFVSVRISFLKAQKGSYEILRSEVYTDMD